MKVQILATLLIMMLFQSCVVQVAIPNRWNERYAKKHDFIECLDADQLKHLIISHYREVFLLGRTHPLVYSSSRLRGKSVGHQP